MMGFRKKMMGFAIKARKERAFICSTNPTKLKRIPAKAGSFIFGAPVRTGAHVFILRDCRLLVDQRQCLHRCGRGSKQPAVSAHVRKPDAPALIILGLACRCPRRTEP